MSSDHLSEPLGQTGLGDGALFAEIFRLSPNPYVLLDAQFTIVEMNEAYRRVTMREREALIGRNMFDAFPSDPGSESFRMLRGSLDRVVAERRVDHIPLIRYDIARPDGSTEERFWSATHTPILDAGGAVARVLQHTVDVTELQRLRQIAADVAPGQAIAESDVFRRATAVARENRVLEGERRRLQALFRQAPGFMAVLRGPDHVFELANDAYLDLVGRRDIVGKPLHEALPEVAEQGFVELLDMVNDGGRPYVGRGVRVLLRKEADGPPQEHYLDFVYQPVVADDGSVVAIFVQGHDITEQRQAEAALQALNASLEETVAERTRELKERDEALRQSQKMEAVGQLTGGIAHDFNNLLQIVLGNLELVQRVLPEEAGRLRRSVGNAMNGARRAAALTQRLLAFSRRQPLSPQALNPNKLVADMSDLMHRTLGETIEVETVLAAGVWQVEVDAHQLENALINLAVNARDAMPEGGKLTIETANARIDEAYALANAEVTPGQYVVICVSDTGTGMDPPTLAKAFEPFFTTKEPGRGTGLGLSMVYGYVKQSGGHVSIYSEVGQGSTVKIYLPRRQGQGSVAAPEEETVVPEGSPGETILVVEDDDDVRANSVEMLRDLGYEVREARDGASALKVLGDGAAVDLLFTDVVLPGGMTGADLAAKARRLRPGLKVLFTTGYARDAIVHHGRLEDGVALITKPFAYADLAAKVRDVIDRGEAPG